MKPRAILRRLVLGHPPDPSVLWHRLLDGRLQIGGGTRLNAALLRAREPDGCVVSIGSNSNIEGSLVLEQRSAKITIGSRTHIGGSSVLASAEKIEIGNDVLVAFEALIMDHNSHSIRFHERKQDVAEWIAGRKDWSKVTIAPVRICDKAWVGVRAIILKGVTIGEGAIVGAGSLVTHDVPPWTIVGGNPAKVIRPLSDEERGIEWPN